MRDKARLVVLASGYGSNLGAVLNACSDQQLNAEVVAVISDQKTAFALERAHHHKIPAEYNPWDPYGRVGKTRQEYDANLAETVLAYQPDYVILAGWMRLLTMAFLAHFPQKVINLHPSLPGMFPGTDAIQRAFAAFQRAEIDHTGAMVHFVPDEGVDDGPVILQAEIPLTPEDTLETLEERIHTVEHRLLVDALRMVITDQT